MVRLFFNLLSRNNSAIYLATVWLASGKIERVDSLIFHYPRRLGAQSALGNLPPYTKKAAD
jgi:hypothetical protein